MTNNPEQQEAIDSVDKRILLLAAAGSGKTKTLIEKIRYFINKGIPAKNILTITFTRDAAREILNRLIVETDKTETFKKMRANKDIDKEKKQYIEKNTILKNLTICTFHSFCYSLLKSDGAPYFDNQFQILPDKRKQSKSDEQFENIHATETVDTVLRKSIIAACEHDAEFYQKLHKYLMENKLERHYEKTINNSLYSNKYICLNGIAVKSKSEQKIVDWFICQGYDVQYEPVEVGGFIFRPDFKLSNKEFYIEHKSDFSGDLNDKMKALQAAGKPVFITYEEWMNNSEVIERELMNILSHVLACDHSSRFSKKFDARFRFLEIELSKFRKDVKRLYNLVKSQNLEIEDVRNVQHILLEHQRIKVFYELFPVVWRYYENLKNKNSLVDFDDLISIALKILLEQENIRNQYRQKFKCILVDEFQDVNPAQVELINVLLRESTYLFCVGDDWQSIYGFRGSNVNFTINFAEYFPGATILKLKKNFRSSGYIVGVGNEVISFNKNKVEKEVVSEKPGKEKVYLYNSNSEDDTLDFIRNRIEYHLEVDGNLSPDDILILGRRTSHYSEIKKKLKRKGIQFSTIHGAKGKESKVVFITGLKDGSGGFPDTWLEDSIYQVIRTTDNDLLLEEERRLFYVAITRARDFLYLLSENGNPSQFIDELPDDLIERETPLF